jgi:hypothetical protein
LVGRVPLISGKRSAEDHSKSISNARFSIFPAGSRPSQSAEAITAELVGAFATTERDEDVLTLSGCVLVPVAGGDGYGVDVTRIPVSHVTAWWMGEPRIIKRGASFGLGVLFPIPLGS